jgi:glucose-1-phosphate thymidylyltransferase
MKAIIPVAGFGTRMRPLTFTVPKVLLNVAGKPMLDHIIDALVEAGVTGVTLIVGYLGDVIERHVRKQYPNLESHFVPQEEMLGLGHAISLGADIHRNDDELLIILGDTLLKADFKRLFATPGTVLGVKEVEDARRFGVVELNAEGRITRMLEKPENPPTNLAIVGVYKIGNPALLFEGLDHIIRNDIRTKKEYQLTDALVYMLERNDPMVPFIIDGWLDCGKPETLFETNRILLADLPKSQQEGYAREHPRAVIVPPVFIGRNCRIEDSVVGPNAVLGDNCVLERAVIRDSIIAEGAQIQHIMLKESLIGSDASVRGHSHVLNIGDTSQIVVS